MAKLGPGARVGDQFSLIRKIGEGGCGEVYLAEQTTLGRNAVVKLMHPELSRDPSYVARFRREAQLAARLTHHHTASIYAFGETPERVLWIAMEYIEGESLHNVLGRESAQTVGELLLPVGDVLDRAGGLGIIHRDVKPDNIIVSPDGAGRRAVLLDFGLARPMEDNDKLTAVGVAVGSPTYMSPEQVFGPAVDSATDRYALGIILFIAVARRPPFRHDDRVQLVLMHKRQPVPSLSTLVPAIAPGHPLDQFFTKALAKQPQDRYPSARQMIVEFLQALDSPSQGVQASPASAGQKDQQAAPALSGPASLPTSAGSVGPPQHRGQRQPLVPKPPAQTGGPVVAKRVPPQSPGSSKEAARSTQAPQKETPSIGTSGPRGADPQRSAPRPDALRPEPRLDPLRLEPRPEPLRPEPRPESRVDPLRPEPRPDPPRSDAPRLEPLRPEGGKDPAQRPMDPFSSRPAGLQRTAAPAVGPTGAFGPGPRPGFPATSPMGAPPGKPPAPLRVNVQEAPLGPRELRQKSDPTLQMPAEGPIRSPGALEEEEEEADEDEDEVLPGHARLLARLSGGGKALDVLCGVEAILGKHRDCDLVCRAFPTPEQDAITHGVSRQHARLRVTGGKLLLEDLSSLNGTYLDDKRITGVAVPLYDEAQIRLGPVLTIEVRLFRSGSALLRRVDPYHGDFAPTLLVWDKLALGEPAVGLVPATGDSITRWGTLQRSKQGNELWWGGPSAVAWQRRGSSPPRPQALQPGDSLALGVNVVEWEQAAKPGLG